MGSIIPAFRHLTEIENLVWSEFKKELKTKNDKKRFNGLIDNPKLSTTDQSLINTSKRTEPVMLIMLFHHSKTLVDGANHIPKEGFERGQMVTLASKQHSRLRIDSH